MKISLLCLLLSLWCPSLVAALDDVMVYGDSTVFNYAVNLQTLRPDFVVYNRGALGDVSWNITRFDSTLAERQWEHVLIMIGVNDIGHITTYDPHDTFKNIWTMATHAKNAGAEVWLMTQTPCSAPTCTTNQPFTLAVANELAHRDLDNLHPHIHFLYLRDQFTTHDWALYSNDGLHLNAAGSEFVAEFVADALP